MRHLLGCLFFLVVMSCGKLGRPDQPDLAPSADPQPSPAPVDENLYTSVRLGLLKRAIDDDLKCSGLKSGIKLSEQTAINGELQWNDSMLVLGRSESNERHQLRKLWLAFDEASGFYGKLLLKDASELAENSTIRINFGVVLPGQNAEPTAIFKRSILIRKDRIHWLDQSGKEQPIVGATISVVENILQFSVPSEIIEGIVLYPFWFVEALHYSDARLTERTGLRFVESHRTHTSQLQIWECHPISFESDEPVIQLLARAELPEVEARRQLGIGRRAWTQVSSAIGNGASPLASVALMTGSTESGGALSKTISQWLNGQEVIVKLDPFEINNRATSPQWHRYQHYARLAQSFANMMMLDLDSADDANLATRLILANAIAAQDIQRSIGIDAQYRFVWPELAIFAEQSDSEGEKLKLDDLSSENIRDMERGLSKILGLSELVASLLSPFDLIGAIERLENTDRAESSLTKTAEILLQLIKKSRSGFTDDGLSGWLNDNAYNVEWSPLQLVDLDQDGLHGFAEYVANSSPLRRDSDADGWSDSSEYLQGTGASDSSDHPDMILADGEFGDWRFLLPNRVSIDPDPSSSACAGESNIVHYAGIYDSSRLVIMANLERDSQIEFQWHAFFEIIVDGVTIAVDSTMRAGDVHWQWNKVTENQPHPRFMTMIPISNRALELEVRLRDILSEQEIEKLQEIRYRVKTSSGGESCDDTQWIKLLKYQSG